jgi:hypothetical protein
MSFNEFLFLLNFRETEARMLASAVNCAQYLTILYLYFVTLSFNEKFFYNFRETEARLLASAANCAQKSAGLCQDDTSSMMSLVGFCLLNGADKNTPATTTKMALGTIHILRNHFYGRGGS